jgi:hypothetical protein
MATIECICPPRADGEPRHAHGDNVTLRPSLDFVGLARARNVVLAMRVEADANAPEIQAAVTEAYLLQGITAWTVVDADGDAVPPTKDAIRGYLLARASAAIVVGDEADGLYSAALMDALDPLVKAASSSSPATPTTESTSQPTDSPTKPRKHSKRSSTTTTQTDGIVRISPRHDGDSNSSQSSASAG